MTELDSSLYELPFDQFQRYAAVADIVERLDVSADARILDVGGAPGPIERFLPGRRTFVADLEAQRAGSYTRASGAALPFADATFAAVLSFDTLEHVPPADREAFLHELRRVSADLVVLAAPFSSPLVHLAEEAVMEFFEARQGYVHPILLEHQEYGLPELGTAVSSFDAAGWAVTSLPSGFLPRWLGAMLVHEDLRADQLPELPKLHAFYNRSVAGSDFRAPSYRRIVVASRSRSGDDLRRVVGALESPVDAPEADAMVRAIASEIFAQRVASVLRSREVVDLENRLRDMTERSADLERQLVDRDAHLLEVRADNDRLREELRAAQRGLWERVRSVVRRPK